MLELRFSFERQSLVDAVDLLRSEQDAANGTKAWGTFRSFNSSSILHVVLKSSLDLIDLHIDRVIQNVSCWIIIIFFCVFDRL